MNLRFPSWKLSVFRSLSWGYKFIQKICKALKNPNSNRWSSIFHIFFPIARPNVAPPKACKSVHFGAVAICRWCLLIFHEFRMWIFQGNSWIFMDFHRNFHRHPWCLTLHIEVPGIFIGCQSACTKKGIGRCSFGQLGGTLRLKPPGISMWYLFFFKKNISIFIFFLNINILNFSLSVLFYFILGGLRFKVQRFPIFQ